MKARLLLGHPPTGHLSEEAVKANWRQWASRLHPDKGGDADEFHRMRQAYEEVLAEAQKPRLCEVCYGVGKVTVLRGWDQLVMDCGRCQGSGKFN